MKRVWKTFSMLYPKTQLLKRTLFPPGANSNSTYLYTNGKSSALINPSGGRRSGSLGFLGVPFMQQTILSESGIFSITSQHTESFIM